MLSNLPPGVRERDLPGYLDDEDDAGDPGPDEFDSYYDDRDYDDRAELAYERWVDSFR